MFKRKLLRRFLVLLFCLAAWDLGLVFSVAAEHGAIITFDVPGAVSTNVRAINAAGVITGSYSDGQGMHGFVRAPDGSFTTFDVSGSVSTSPVAINPAGAITGYYDDGNEGVHAFLRSPDGSFTSIDVPEHPTEARSINPAGVISGTYTDEIGATHVFLRAVDGTITIIDAPGAGTGYAQGTFTWFDGLAPSGAVTGSFLDLNYVSHSFVGKSDGEITTFEVSGTNCSSSNPEAICGTSAVAINNAGAITGWYADEGLLTHGFLRTVQGAIATFDFPGADWTQPYDINPAGVITGVYQNSSGGAHGFLRTRDGAFISFDPPGSAWTWAVAINESGLIAGSYSDGSAYHGYVRIP